MQFLDFWEKEKEQRKEINILYKNKKLFKNLKAFISSYQKSWETIDIKI